MHFYQAEGVGEGGVHSHKRFPGSAVSQFQWITHERKDLEHENLKVMRSGHCFVVFYSTYRVRETVELCDLFYFGRVSLRYKP